MSVLVVLIFEGAQLLLPTAWSFVLALGAAFGTQIWSTASRGLWSHTWQILLLGVVAYLLIYATEKNREPSGWLVATLAAWAYFVRPASAIDVIALMVFFRVRSSSQFVPFVVALTFWALTYLFINMSVFGSAISSYEMRDLNQFVFRSVHFTAERTAAVLFSPARGLFIFVPIFVGLLYTVFRFWRRINHLELIWLSLIIILGHILLVALFGRWWGGGGFGPRLLTDTVPWFFVLAGFGAKALHDSFDRSQQRKSGVVLVGLLLFLLTLSVAINSRGALSKATLEWNVSAGLSDANLASAWDWRHPQFLAGLGSN
jgi:hypothetical protein